MLLFLLGKKVFRNFFLKRQQKHSDRQTEKWESANLILKYEDRDYITLKH